MTASRVARRAGELSPFYVMEVVRAAREREEATGDVLHLEVGQPATGAPKTARDAARAALDTERPLGYTDATGTPELRTRIAADYADRHGLDVHPDRIAGNGDLLQGHAFSFAPALLGAAPTNLVNENVAHHPGGGGKKEGAPLPALGLAAREP